MYTFKVGDIVEWVDPIIPSRMGKLAKVIRVLNIKGYPLLRVEWINYVDTGDGGGWFPSRFKLHNAFHCAEIDDRVRNSRLSITLEEIAFTKWLLEKEKV